MKTNRFLSLAAIFATVLAFFACSNEADPPPPSPGGEQSGNGEQQQVFCKLNAGNCSQMSLSTCMELVNAGAAQIVSNCTTDPEPQPSSSSVAPPSQPSSSSVAPPPPPPSSSSVVPPPPVSSSSRSVVYISSSSLSSAATSGTFIDSRENRIYKWVKIGTQTWMAENLNYTPTSGSSKCPNNVTANCATHGRQYDWATAMDLASSYNTTSINMPSTWRKGICPTDWHLPHNAEWNTLITYVGANPGTKLKATSGWPSGANGTDNYGFAALPGGYVEYGSVWDDYLEVGTMGLWWTATEYNANYAYDKSMNSGTNVNAYGQANYDYNMTKRNMLSVRCVKD